MARKEQWFRFNYDPENSFHNVVMEMAVDADEEDMELFAFHQLRTEFGDGMLEETRSPSGSLRVLNMDAAKIVKGTKKGVLSGILYLSAGDGAGVEVCPHRTGKFPTWRHQDHPGSNIIFGAKNKHGQCVSLKNAKFHLSDPSRATDFMKDAVDKANEFPSELMAFSYLGEQGFKRDAGCSGLCLGHTAGHARVSQAKADKPEENPVQRVRMKKTKQLLSKGKEANTQFLDDIEHDIKAIVRKAKRKGLTPAIRLNGTSDLYWHQRGKLMKDGKSFFELFPDVQFYDYTKNLDTVFDFLDGKLPKNYHVTFSFGGSNWPQAEKVLEKGGNVAVGFRLRKKDEFPLKWRGYDIVDGDETDLRFADPTGVPGKIVGLRTKGASFNMDSEFIVEPDDAEVVWPEDSPFHEKQGRKGAEQVRKTREVRDKTAAKYAIAYQIEEDVQAAFEMIYDDNGLTLKELQKRTKIPMKDLRGVYDKWAERFRLTERNTKMLPKDADRVLTASNMSNLLQLLSRRAMKADVYKPSGGLEGADLRNHIKGTIKKETFAEYMGVYLTEETKLDPKDCPQWSKLSTDEQNALAILVKQHDADPYSWKVALGLSVVSFDALVKKGLAERQSAPKVNSFRLSCPTLLGEATTPKALNDTQEKAMRVLKNAYERARKPGVDISMQWVAPSAYNMKAATFEFLCKRGLAERRMNPGKDSNRWYYRWVRSLNENTSSILHSATRSLIGE